MIKLFYKHFSKHFNIIERYLLKSYLQYHLVTLSLLYLILVINQLLVEIELLVANNISLWLILELIIAFSPIIFMWAFPFSSMLATLLALTSFSKTNQILAMRLQGFTTKEIFKPFALYSLMAFIVAFIVTNWLMPISTNNYEEVARRIASSNPHIILEEGRFSEFAGRFISIDTIDGDNFQGIFIIDNDEDGRRRVSFAPSGRLVNADNAFVLQLNNFSSLATPNNFWQLDFRTIEADTMIYSFTFDNLANINIGEESGLELLRSFDLEYQRLQRLINERLNNNEGIRLAMHRAYQNQNETELRNLYQQYIQNLNYRPSLNTLKRNYIKLHERIMMPVLVVLFCFLAFSLSLNNYKKYNELLLIIGVILLFVYWLLLIFVRGQYLSGDFPPIFLFTPDIIFIILAGSLYLRGQR
ncbi:MAG: LptF/LptG family permease [Spirochaetaceae bacterium]|nr:LptF/LptG family permease [Spirochaetaceae bacterium]